MQFQRDGAAHYPQAVNNILPSLLRALEFSPEGKGRSRMIALRSLTECLRHSSLPRIANELLGPKARPVRAVVFDKTAEENWALTWHQDRTIAVQQRSETPGFWNWTVKQGIVHCEPPFALLAGMITVRLHPDPAGLDNAPLKIAPGSHHRGVIAEADIAGAVRACGTFTCTADAGDIWVYATPVLHASDAALQPGHRRVLQIDYSADRLPGALAWLPV